MSRRVPTLRTLVQGYFQDHLRSVRGASDHTVRAYRDALRLFFIFVGQRAHRQVSALALDDLNTEVVLAFLARVS